MAVRLEYDVKHKPARQSAHEELQQLLQSLHEHGALRLANDIVVANTDIAKVLVSGLNEKGSMRAIQNIAILFMALSRVEPASFYRIVFALKDACVAASAHEAGARADQAPGLSGAYKLLNDEELWRALTPLIEGLKALAGGLARKVDKPISAFSGKPTDA